MTSNDQLPFWTSIPPSLRQAVELAIPGPMFQARLSQSEPPNTLATRYAQLKVLLKEYVAEEQSYKKTPAPATQPLSPLFPLALLCMETARYPAAEDRWRTLLPTPPHSNSDPAITSNLIEVLNIQHKYPEAERLSMQLSPPLQRELGQSSPQALGLLRKLMLSLVGQDKREKAREVWKRGEELVAMIDDAELRRDEADALSEVTEKIDSLS